jgi:hypothetical protein
MNKIRITLCTLLLVVASNLLPAFAQQNYLALATIFTGATQTITSNAAGTPILVPAGGNLLNLQTLDTVAVAGTTVADATAMSGSIFVHRATGANGTAGVKFASTATAGICHLVMNTTAGVLNIYAASGGTVNGGSVNAVFAALTGIKPVLCCSTAADTWICS